MIKPVIAIAICAAALAAVQSARANPGKVDICHRNQGASEWNLISIPASALSAHLAHQWGGDIYPVPPGGCPEVKPPVEPPVEPPLNVHAVPVLANPVQLFLEWWNK